MSVRAAMRAESKVAKQYEDDGYTVILNPPKELIPFDLEGYTPDILATNNDENIIIEVKITNSSMDNEKLLKISDIIQSHPGWKFSVITVSEEELGKSKKNKFDLDINKIAEGLSLIEENLENPSVSGFLVPQLWVCYISILSILLRKDGIEIENLSDLSIVNSAYSEGHLNHEQLEASRRFLNLRNFAAHNIAQNINVIEVKCFFKLTVYFFDEMSRQVES